MIPRFFCPFPLHPGATVELAAEAAHHALKVLRVGAGDTAILFDGRGGQWHATLHPAGKSLRATLTRFEDADADHERVGAGAAAQPARLRVQERGAGEVEVIQVGFGIEGGQRVQRLTEAGSQHWQSLAAAACEQCGRNRIPAVAPILDLPQYLGIAARENTLRFVCAPGVSGSLRKLAVPTAPVVLLVGPEGGFEAGELLAAHAAGFQPIQLGPRVLRTETAGLGAVAAMMALWGDW